MGKITGIINMTEKCNMCCEYCYAGNAVIDYVDINKINQEFNSFIPKLKKFIDEIVEYNEKQKTKLIFHGGEPLLISIDNYKLILQYLHDKQYDNVELTMQTNGTLLNDENIRFLYDNKIKVGLSIDGDKNSHDFCRYLKNKKGTHDIIVDKLHKMKLLDTSIGGLMTINKHNKDRMKENYNFFKEEKMNFSINCAIDPKKESVDGIYITPEDYAEKACELFDLWFYDNESYISIPMFEKIMMYFLSENKVNRDCMFAKDCSKSFVTIDTNGDLYSCNRFCGLKEFAIGNIENDSLKKIIDEMIVYESRWNLLEETECKECEVKEMCFGGCPYNAYACSGSIFTKDYLCEAYKKIFYHIYGRVKEYEHD